VTDKTTTEAAAIAALSLSQKLNTFDFNDFGNFTLLPPGYSVADLEHLQCSPNRVRTKQTFVDPKSLAAYLTRFTAEAREWGEGAFLTVDYKAANIGAVLGYSDRFSLNHHDHVATYQAQVGRKFQKWREMCGKAHTQVALALFLESRAVDVMKPDAADIMEMVLKFEATKTVDFKSSTRLSDGARQFVYVEDTQQRGSFTLPDHIVILVPVYEGLEPQPVKIWLRYRIEDAKLRLVLEVHDEDEVMRQAFERCVDAFLSEAPKGSKPVLHITG